MSVITHTRKGLVFPGSSTALAFGDSLTAGYNASVPGACWVEQLGMARGWIMTNGGVSGQTVTTGTGNAFSTASIPTKTASNNYIFFGWGINDCWKSPSLAQFNTDYTAAINVAKTRGWTGSIVIITGFYCLDNANFTQAQYLTYVSETLTIASNTSVQILNLFNYMSSNGGASLLADGIVHVNDLGSTVIKNYINQNLT